MVFFDPDQIMSTGMKNKGKMSQVKQQNYLFLYCFE